MFFSIFLIFQSFSIKISDHTLTQAKSEFIKIITDLPRGWKPGYPDLPAYPVALEFSELYGISVKPVKAETLRLSLDLKPVEKPHILMEQNPEVKYEKDPWIYSLDSFYPGSYYSQRIYKSKNSVRVELVLYPFRYNPAEKLLEIVKEFYISTEGLEKTKRQLLFPELFIIAPMSFSGLLEEYIKDREIKGFVVSLKTIEEISGAFPGVDIAEKIRNYLKSVAKDGGKQYVLLVGDESLIPVRYLYAFDCQAHYNTMENRIPSDLYYSDLDGDYNADCDTIFGEIEDSVDLYSDLIVGRIPVRDSVSLRNYLNKLSAYENPQDSILNYVLDYSFIAQILWDYPFTDQGIHKDYIQARYLPVNINVEKFYESTLNADRDRVLAALGKGVHVVNHDGHGWYTGMWLNKSDYLGISDTAFLNKNGKYCIFYSIGCWVGALDFNSIAENYVNANSGPIAFIANSRYGWGAPGNPGFGYSDIFDNKFFELLFSKRDLLLGDLFSSHKSFFIPFARDTNVYRWIYYELNLLGDPTIYIWREVPRGLEVLYSIETSGLSGCVTSSGQPVPGAMVTISDGERVITKTITSSDGYFHLDPLSFERDSLLLTVWKPGFKKYQNWIRRNVSISCRSWFSERGEENYIVAGQSKYLKIEFSNLSGEFFKDSLNPVATEFEFSPSTIYLALGPQESFLCSLLVKPLDTLRVNKISRLLLKGSRDTFTLPINIAWPEISYEGADFDTACKQFKFRNNSYIALPIKFLGAIDKRESRVYIADSSSFYVLADSIFAVKICNISESVNTLSFYFEVWGRIFEKTVKFTSDTVIFSETFENGIANWSGDTDYFDVREDPLSSNQYLTSREGLSAYAVDALLFSPVFDIRDEPIIMSFDFRYIFPIYGTTGVRVSVHWLRGNEVIKREIITLLAAGGALEEKSIEGNWKNYSFELLPPNGADHARLEIRFTKERDSSAIWYMDNIKITQLPGRLVKSQIATLEDRILSYQVVKKGGSLNFVVFSEREGEEQLEIFNSMGRLLMRKNVNLFKGLNEINLELRGKTSGVLFIKFMGQTKKVVILK
jgi:hypothetical protein